MNNNYCVIMAGGVGSRFWPMSKTNRPKQFIDILGVGKSLIQMTYTRMSKLFPKENIFIVTNIEYVDLVKEHLPDVVVDNILQEPQRRNTAPCIAYAAYKIQAKDPNANLVVAPSDHLVTDENEFLKCLEKSLQITAEDNCIATLGIKPHRPDTGYGYIQTGTANHELNTEFSKVKTFTEKPDLEMAQYFIDSGDFLWNSGIFIWSAKTIIDSFTRFVPDMAELFEEGKSKYWTNEETDFINNVYQVCTNISIDYAVMEKAKKVYVLPCDFGWSDLGTWGSLYEQIEQDEDQNAVNGKRVRLYESSKCVVTAPDDKLVVVQGLEDYIVVDSENALLVCKKEKEQKIRQFVKDLKIEFGNKFI